MGHHCGSPLGAEGQGSQGALGFTPRGRRLGGGRLPPGGLYRGGATYPSLLYNPLEPLAHSSYFPILSSLACLPRLELFPRARGNSTLRTSSRYWISILSPSSSAASLDRSLDDIYTRGVCRGATNCGTCLHQLVRLHDLEVGFACLHQQNLCGNVSRSLGLQRYEHRRYSVALQLHRVDHGLCIIGIFLFSDMNPNSRHYISITI
jgi:hypothetical protein